MFKEVFKPTLDKIIITIVIFIFLFLIINIPKACPAMERMCPVDANTPGALELRSGEYFVSGRSIPFSCNQTCTDSEYIYELTKIIASQLIIPIIIIYAIISLLKYFLIKNKKNN